MMLTRLDRAADGYLQPAEIERMLAAGAKRVVVEAIEPEAVTAIGCFMKRGDGAGRIAWRLPGGSTLESLTPEARTWLLARIERRLREYHDTLPLTDEEWEERDRSERR